MNLADRLTGNPVENSSRLASGMITDGLLGVGLNRGEVLMMGDFDRLVDERLSGYG